MLKVLFPDVRDPVGGKSFFLHNLYKELEKLGINVVFSGEHDIQFGSIRFHTKSTAKKVLRLDGVYHNTAKRWETKNLEMRKQADSADAIICQSVFGYEMVRRFVKCDINKAVIIGNGADLNAEYELPVVEHKHNFLAVSKWRPHKRLEDIIESFLLADIEDSCLWVIGKADLDKYTDKRIIKIGNLFDRRKLYGYMKLATASIHLCWFDCCPNSVVEAVAMGCPVICNNTGGTHEIVRPANGIVLYLDTPYDYMPVDLYNPPKIDRRKVAQAMSECAEKSRPIYNNHVDIRDVALKYKECFERVA